MGKIYSVAIIGLGNRGYAYGNFMWNMKDMYKIVSVCDVNKIVRDNAKVQWQISDENIFDNETEFFKEKRADVLVLATQDRDHVRMAITALELGYDILLEKPISPIAEELKQILEVYNKYNKKVVVCHVLRYAPMFVKIKEVLDSGVIGKLIHIESTEKVCYWHQLHSFVRGNWRNDQTTSPMIMQKCCHDMDLLQYYAGSKCNTVYSVGDLTFFNKNNKPQGAADRCKDCKYKMDCQFSAERVYIELWKKWGRPEYGWPFSVVCKERPNTEEKLRKAYEESEYGRCAFVCDNNVVDNQQLVMTFENGVKAVHTMTAFTEKGGRKMCLHGTRGEIELNSDTDDLTVYVYGGEKQVYKSADLIKEKDNVGHGGGDGLLVRDLYKVLNGEGDAQTTLEKSVESHLMALASEKSRREGRIIKVHEDL